MTLRDTEEGGPRTDTMQDGDICFTHKDTEQRFVGDGVIVLYPSRRDQSSVAI